MALYEEVINELGSASWDSVLQKYECLVVYILYFNLTNFSFYCLYCVHCLFIFVCAYCLFIFVCAYFFIFVCAYLFIFVCAYCLSIYIPSPCSPSRALDWHLKSIETNYTIKGQSAQSFWQGFHCSFNVWRFMCTFQHQY